MARRTDEEDPGPAPEAASFPGDDEAAIDTDLTKAVTLVPDVLADSLGEYLAAWWKRIRGGESGALPIILGLIAIIILFQVENSHFLTALNIVNLVIEAAFFILLGAAEMFALLLGEIDLSVGFVSAIGGTLIAALIASPYNWPLWAGVIVGLGACSFIGFLHGTLITRLHLPSFVVTLGGLLFWSGFLIYIFDVDKGSVGGVLSINNKVISNLVYGSLTPLASWISLVVLVGLFAVLSISQAARRRSRGLSAPPLSITILKIVITAAAGAALVWICGYNRGTALVVEEGVPWVVPFVIAVIVGLSFLLGRTRFGRYIYAIGASPEAARRAGINVAWIRTFAFTLVGLVAALAGIVYESRLGSIDVGYDGGTYVLYAVAAAVIGGTSLMGGRGKAIHPLIGGLVLAVVANGLDLINITTAGQEMATALVLVIAVTIDSVVRGRGQHALKGSAIASVLKNLLQR
jgi:D-xylose transport system permease protein